jgi:hypothetical protein
MTPTEARDYWPKAGRPPLAPSPALTAGAERALEMVGALWSALAADDDAAVRRLCSAFVAPASPAESLRAGLRATRETCRRMACSMTVRILSSGAFLILSIVSRRPFGLDLRDEPALVMGWWLVVDQVDGEPRVVGCPWPDAEVIGLVHVIPPPGPSQPVN